MAGTGGKRPGAGRKPKAEQFARPIALAEKRIADALPDVIDSMLHLAAGVWVEQVTEAGDRRVFQRPPDFKACAYLVDRILGRATPTPTVEQAGPARGKINIREAVVKRTTLPDEDDA